MARSPRSWRDRRRAPERREPLTEEAVEALRREGALSVVIRLPVIEGSARPPVVEGSAREPVSTGAPMLSSPHGAHDLCLADGTRARLTPAGLLVGRRRSASADPDASSTPRLELRDETRSLSREHAHLVVDPHGVAWITDLGSGNGTTVRRLGGPKVELVPGTPLALAVGDVLHLGGTTVHLRRAGPETQES